MNFSNFPSIQTFEKNYSCILIYLCRCILVFFYTCVLVYFYTCLLVNLCSFIHMCTFELFTCVFVYLCTHVLVYCILVYLSTCFLVYLFTCVLVYLCNFVIIYLFTLCTWPTPLRPQDRDVLGGHNYNQTRTRLDLV